MKEIQMKEIKRKGLFSFVLESLIKWGLNKRCIFLYGITVLISGSIPISHTELSFTAASLNLNLFAVKGGHRVRDWEHFPHKKCAIIHTYIQFSRRLFLQTDHHLKSVNCDIRSREILLLFFKFTK